MPHPLDTLRPNAGKPVLNTLDVDVAPPPERIHTIDRTITDRDGTVAAEATLNHKVRVHYLDNWYLNERDGLMVDGENGDIHPAVRRYKAAPGQMYTVTRQTRGKSRPQEPTQDRLGHVKEYVPEIDSSQDAYYFQAQGIMPVHNVIGPSDDSWWTPGGRTTLNAWRDQLLDPAVYGVFEQRFSHRIPDLPEGYVYDPKRPPPRGLINWHELDIEWVLKELAAYQEKLATKPGTTPKALEALRVWKIAKLNLEALRDRFAAWRAGKPYESLHAWNDRRPAVIEHALGLAPKEFVPPAPVIIDLEAERGKIAARLSEELGAKFAQMVEQLDTRVEQARQEARSDAESQLRAELERVKASFRVEYSTATQELAEARALIAAQAAAAQAAGKESGGIAPAEVPAQDATGEDGGGAPPAAAGEAQHPRAYLLGREAAAKGGVVADNPYSRKAEQELWLAGFTSYSTP